MARGLQKRTETAGALQRLLLLAVFSVFSCSSIAAQDSVLTVALPDGQSMELVWVAGGTYEMGGSTQKDVKVTYAASRPLHTVTLNGYHIGRYEVTQGQWRAVMGENPSKFSAAGGVGDSLPVESVSWTEAVQFCTLLSQMTGHIFRLPTEAEWEYAARGGAVSKGQSYAGCSRGQLALYCRYCVNSEGHTAPVGRLLPNELGLYDMSGNVAEWCSDWLGEYPDGPVTNPQGPRDGEARILRGGHYNSISSACSVFDRGWYIPSGKYEYYGLRVVMEE